MCFHWRVRHDDEGGLIVTMRRTRGGGRDRSEDRRRGADGTPRQARGSRRRGAVAGIGRGEHRHRGCTAHRRRVHGALTVGRRRDMLTALPDAVLWPYGCRTPFAGEQTTGRAWGRERGVHCGWRSMVAV